MIIMLIVFYLLGMYRLFEKLGLKGWYIFIPFYNIWKLYEVNGLEWYWFLLYVGPLVLLFKEGPSLSLGVIAMSVASLANIYNIAKKFHKPKSWVVISFFFEEITLPILGLSKDEICDNSVVTTPNAMFDDKNTVKAKAKKVSKKVEQAVESKIKSKEDQ